MVSGRPSPGQTPAQNYAILSQACDEIDNAVAELNQLAGQFGTLNAGLGAEVNNRVTAINSARYDLGQALVNAAQVWAQALATETSQRQEAVSAARADLGAAVQAEAGARQEAVDDASAAIIKQLGDQITALSTTLRKAVGDEQQTRKNADDGLGQRIDAVADQLADKASQEDLATGLQDSAKALSDAVAQLNAAIQVLRDSSVAHRFELLGTPWRPGDSPARFSQVATPVDLGLAAPLLPELPPSTLAYGDSGPVYRVQGAALLATRPDFALELGRLYRLRYVVQRRTNPSDPANDAVTCGVVFKDQSLRVIGGVVPVKTYPGLTASLGRQECEALLSRTANLGGILPVPANARFVVPVVRTFGLDAITDVEVLGIEDVTSAFVLAPLDAQFNERLAALEALSLGARVDELEQRVGNPAKMTFQNRSFAINATIPANVQVVELLGWQTAGDGGAGLFLRTAGSPPQGVDSFTSDGALFVRVRPLADVAAQVVDAGFEQFMQGLPTEPTPVAGGRWNNGGVPSVTQGGDA